MPEAKRFHVGPRACHKVKVLEKPNPESMPCEALAYNRFECPLILVRSFRS
jgi:hypothetical protein